MIVAIREGYRMVRRLRHTKLSLYRLLIASALPFFVLHACVMFAIDIDIAIHLFFVLWFPACLCILPITEYIFVFLGFCFYANCFFCFFFLSFLSFLPFFFVGSRWSFVDVPLIFSYPADHVPDWHPRIQYYWVWLRPNRSM